MIPAQRVSSCAVQSLKGVECKILQQYLHTGGAELSQTSLTSAGCIWQICNFPCVMSMCSQLSSLLLAVVCAETSLHAAYRLSPAFWKPLCMNGLSVHMEMSLIDTKTQEKLHPRCFCYDLVVFSVNTWHL